MIERMNLRRFWIRIGFALMSAVAALTGGVAHANSGSSASSGVIHLVRDGQGSGAVVIPANAPPSVTKLANDFVNIVQRATGVRLPVRTDVEEQNAPSRGSRIYLGACLQRKAAGLSLTEPEAETYEVAVRNGDIYVYGKPARSSVLKPGSKIDPWYDSDPMRWALNDFLKEQLGVRWLWPGTLGTHVPKQAGFAIPASDRTYRPRLKMRRLGIATMRRPEEAGIRQEAIEWVSNHQGGERDNIPLSHGFIDWWDRYHQTHPDYFAVPPKGMSQRAKGYVKLNLTNPKVLEQIVENYIQAGKPSYWCVTPNDGTGFDASDEVRKWDLPPNQNPRDIWLAKVNLTPRYVKWWNMIYERLAAINPEVKLVTMAYSVYRTPPPPERPLTAKTVIGIVPSYRAYEVWSGWAQYTDELILRPNWGHYGANGPHIPLREFAAYMKYASENKMVGFALDSILGRWATQGINYYLMARLMVQPELSVDEIIQEYCSAFGKGAPKIGEYIRFWESYSTEWAHGHKIHKVEGSKYDRLITEGKIMDNPIIGPKEALPYVYPDDVMTKAYGLLEEADALIGDSDPEARQRVDFLRKGLDELVATRDCMALGRIVQGRRTPELLKQFQEKADALEELRTRLTPTHVIWGGFETRREDKVKIKVRPRNIEGLSSTGDDQF